MPSTAFHSFGECFLSLDRIDRIFHVVVVEVKRKVRKAQKMIERILLSR